MGSRLYKLNLTLYLHFEVQSGDSCGLTERPTESVRSERKSMVRGNYLVQHI